jgi:FKBP-type peptidyl-prolyl cis-trans isomerase 2
LLKNSSAKDFKGDVIELPINCDEIYGPRDESLVFTDHIDNVPEEYRKIGMTVTMENEHMLNLINKLSTYYN